MNKIQKGIPKPREVYITIEPLKIDDTEIPLTEIKASHYSNRIFIIITQLNKLGAMISGEVDNPSDDPLVEKTFDVKTIMGSTDRESYEVYCRSILELLNNNIFIFKKLKEAGAEVNKGTQNPLANKAMLLSISLAKYPNEDVEMKMFKKIMDVLKDSILKIL